MIKQIQNRLHRLCICLLPIVYCLLHFSCGEPEENTEKKFFRYNESGGIASLDPASAKTVEIIWAVNQMFNGLVQLNDSLEVIPCIAKSWEISDSGKVYTFHLRNDIFFHDHPFFPNGKGRKVVAQDFVLSLFRLMDMDEEQSAKYLFSNIARDERSDNLGFIAPDDSTFVIYLNEPFPPFLNILTMQYCSVIPNEIAEHYGPDFRRNPVGTGPFAFKAWEEGVKLVLVKNENYFERDGENRLPYLDGITVNFIKDKQNAFIDFEKGDADMLSGADMVNIDLIIDKEGKLKPEYAGKFKMQTGSYLKTDYLGFMIDMDSAIVKKSPLRIKEVRQAIGYAIDREKIVKHLRNSIGTSATQGFIPKGMPSFDSTLQGYTYNPDKSRELLKMAGFPGGKGIDEITLNVTEQYLELSQFVEHELEEIGIPVKIYLNRPIVQLEIIANAQVNFFRKSWVADYADAENFFACFYSKNLSPKGPNYTHFKNKKYDELFEESLHESDNTKRFEIYKEMDKILIEEAPIVPLFYDQVFRLVNNKIENFTLNPMNLLNLKRVKKK
ncbi:MAG: ABC transporter substrate-binding protein [Bacteroidetes bacterium]|nr:ABC transporter substrate-binding protein [Bacteroidota bacterium]